MEEGAAAGMKPVRPSLQDREHKVWVEEGLNNSLHNKNPRTTGLPPYHLLNNANVGGWGGQAEYIQKFKLKHK